MSRDTFLSPQLGSVAMKAEARLAQTDAATAMAGVDATKYAHSLAHHAVAMLDHVALRRVLLEALAGHRRHPQLIWRRHERTEALALPVMRRRSSNRQVDGGVDDREKIRISEKSAACGADIFAASPAGRRFTPAAEWLNGEM